MTALPRSLLEQLESALVWTRIDELGRYRVTDMNARAEALLGQPRQSAIGSELRQLAPADWINDWQRLHAESARSGQPQDWHPDASDSDGTCGPAIHVQIESASERRFVSLITGAHGAIPAAQELLARSELHEAMFEQRPECVKLMDSKLVVLRMNPAGLSLLGMADVDSVNRAGLLRFVIPEDRSRFLDLHRQVIGGQPGISTFRVSLPTGELIHVESISIPVRDPQTAEIHHLATVRDITAAVGINQALRQAENRLALALDAANIGEWSLDLQTGQSTRNPSHDRCFGYASMLPEWNLSTFLEHVLPDYHNLVQAAFQRASDSAAELDLEFPVRWPDGSIHWLWVRGIRDSEAPRGSTVLAGIVIDVTSRRTAEEQLRVAEERWRFAIEGSLDGVWDWDIATNRVEFSRRWSEILGEPADTASGDFSELSRRVHPQDLALSGQQLERHLRGETPEHLAEYRIRAADGQWKWIRARGLVIERDAEGNALRMVGTNTDIDALKSDIARAENLRLRLALAVEGSGFGVWELDLATGQLIWDQRMYAIYGQTASSFDVSPERWRECANPDDRAEVDARLHDLMNGIVVDLFIFRIRRGDNGEERHIEANGFLQRDADGNPQRLVGMNRDVTERWQSNRQIQLLGAGMSRLWDMVLIFKGEEDGIPRELVYSNSAFHAKFGSGEAAVERLLQGIGSSIAATLTGVADGDSLRSNQRQTLRFSAPDLEEIWLEFEMAWVPDERYAVGHWVLVGHDISERQAAEQAIRELNASLEKRVADRTEELRSFSYTLSHELSAPMRGIDGWSQALEEDAAALLDPPSREHLTRVRSEVKRMQAMLEGLHRLGRISQAELTTEEVDVSALSGEITARLRQQHPERAVEIAIQPRLRAPGDRTLLELALTNLIGNAWLYTSSDSRAKIQVSGESHETQSVIHVQDNGIGFDPAQASVIFEPFRRLHQAREFPGTGIGLALVDRIARRHGGSIRAESQPGHGARFSLTLPTLARTAQPLRLPT